jgi:hypothetical protein
MLTSRATIRSYRPWISSTGAWMPARSCVSSCGSLTDCRLAARLGELGRPGVRPVDVIHQLVGRQALVIDVHAKVVRDGPRGPAPQ